MKNFIFIVGFEGYEILDIYMATTDEKQALDYAIETSSSLFVCENGVYIEDDYIKFIDLNKSYYDRGQQIKLCEELGLNIIKSKLEDLQSKFIEDENKKKQQKEDKERKLYEKLKAKYENE